MGARMGVHIHQGGILSVHEIDLGDELKISVKYAGQTYSLREPTVSEIDAFREQATDADSMQKLVALLERLGMPKGIVEKMGMSKARQLIDGLLDLLTKKK
jgi:hypothetical protein